MSNAKFLWGYSKNVLMQDLTPLCSRWITATLSPGLRFIPSLFKPAAPKSFDQIFSKV
jgi:hypothetical protein